MTQIGASPGEFTVLPVAPAARRARAGSRQTQVNEALFWALLPLILLSPLPFGSVEPFFWAVSAVYVGLAVFIYALLIARLGEDFRTRLGRLAVPAALSLAFCLALLVQLLPLGRVLGPFEIGATALTSQTISIAPGMTLLTVLRQVTFGLLFFLLVQVLANDGRRARFLDIVLVAILAYAVYAMVALQAGDTILGIEKWTYFGSATGTFVNRNSFATFLAFGAVIAAAQAASHAFAAFSAGARGSRSAVLVYTLAFVILILVGLATQSRMGVFAALAGSLVAVLLTAARGGGLRTLAVAIPLAVLGIAAGFVFYGAALFERLGSVETDTETRLQFYQQILDLIGMRPWTGFGGGSFELAFPLVHQLPVSPDVTWDRGHNIYLTLWSEAGLVAGTLPILAVAWLAGLMLLRLPAAVSRSGATALVAGISAVVVAGVHSLVDFSLEIHAIALLFVALLAVGAAAALAPVRHGA